MAWTSLVGIASLGLLARIDPGSYALNPELFGNWVAAAPVVALGAPLGAFVVHRIGREPTLFVVAILCALQFVWTLWHERGALGAAGLAVAFAGLLAFSGAFHAMYVIGRRTAARRGSDSAE